MVEQQVGMGLTVWAPPNCCRIERGFSPGEPDSPVKWRAIKSGSDPQKSALPDFDVTINVRNWPQAGRPTAADIHALEAAELESSPDASIERGFFRGVPCLKTRGTNRTSTGEPIFITSYHIFGDKHIAIGVVSNDGFDAERHQEAEVIAFSLGPINQATMETHAAP